MQQYKRQERDMLDEYGDSKDLTSARKGATQLNSCMLELHLDSLARDSVVALLVLWLDPFRESGVWARDCSGSGLQWILILSFVRTKLFSCFRSYKSIKNDLATRFFFSLFGNQS